MSKRSGIITGCGKGIGLAITNKMLTKNNDIFIYGVSRTKNKELQILEKSFLIILNFLRLVLKILKK